MDIRICVWMDVQQKSNVMWHIIFGYQIQTKSCGMSHNKQSGKTIEFPNFPN